MKVIKKAKDEWGCGWIGDSAGSITMLPNMYSEVHNVCSIHVNKIILTA